MASVESTAECYLPVGDSQVRQKVLANQFQTDPLHQHHSPTYLENDPVTWVDEGKMGTVCYKMRGSDGELLWRLGSRSKEERYQPSLRYWNPTSLTVEPLCVTTTGGNWVELAAQGGLERTP